MGNRPSLREDAATTLDEAELNSQEAVEPVAVASRRGSCQPPSSDVARRTSKTAAPAQTRDASNEATPLKWASKRKPTTTTKSAAKSSNNTPPLKQAVRQQLPIAKLDVQPTNPGSVCSCCCCCRASSSSSERLNFCTQALTTEQQSVCHDGCCLSATSYCISSALEADNPTANPSSGGAATDYNTFFTMKQPPPPGGRDIVHRTWGKTNGHALSGHASAAVDDPARASAAHRWKRLHRNAPLDSSGRPAALRQRTSRPMHLKGTQPVTPVSRTPRQPELRSEPCEVDEPGKFERVTSSCVCCDADEHKTDPHHSTPVVTSRTFGAESRSKNALAENSNGGGGGLRVRPPPPNGDDDDDHNARIKDTGDSKADRAADQRLAFDVNANVLPELDQAESSECILVKNSGKFVVSSQKGEHLYQSNSQQQYDHLNWNQLALKYGRMSHQGAGVLSSGKGGLFLGAGQGGGATAPITNQHEPIEVANHQDHDRRRHGMGARRKLRGSCFCHVFCALAYTLFPILSAFKDYSLPGDLLTDLAAGFTIGVLHIPQGMAYGLLSGVEPIYGLYVSFIPVVVMSLMSKSRHVSYGTFAIISMLLVNIINQVQSDFRNELTLNANSSLVITDNHQPPDAIQQHIIRSQMQNQQSATTTTTTGEQAIGQTIGSTSGGRLQVPFEANHMIEPTNDLIPSAIEILACACIVSGLLQMTMSVLRLGVLSLIFSDQLVSSFTAAGAVHVLSSQLGGLVDANLKPDSEELFKLARIWWQFFTTLTSGNFNRTTALLSLGSIVFLVSVKELLEPVLRRRFKRLTCLPSELILMAVIICCSGYYQLAANFNVKIVGQVPTGLPDAKVPNLELVPYVFKECLSVALISFVMNLSIARVYANKFRYELDPNQELFALGSANVVSSFFSCFPCASSLSRSSVQSSLNVKSQLCGLFSSCIVFLIVCYCAHILHDLPKSTLSCIIVVALKGILIQIRDFCHNWRLSKLDATVWLVTFVSVVVCGVTHGLIIGIIVSLFMIFLRLLAPNHSVLARLPGTELYVDKNAFAYCQEVEQVKIFRFNSALCYLNRTNLKTKIEKLLPHVYEPSGFSAICSQFHSNYGQAVSDGASGGGCNNHHQVRFLVIDCSALSYCDFSGATTLIELIDDLADKKICVFLAACPIKLIDMIERLERGLNILAHNVYPTISGAIAHINYLRATNNPPQTSSLRTQLTPTMARGYPPDGSDTCGPFFDRTSGSESHKEPDMCNLIIDLH